MSKQKIEVDRKWVEQQIEIKMAIPVFIVENPLNHNLLFFDMVEEEFEVVSAHGESLTVTDKKEEAIEIFINQKQ